jgi:hypothetical protein
MSLSRRQFVYLTSLSVVATSAGTSLLAQSEAQDASKTFTEEGAAILANLSLRDFEWLIGERFSISLSGLSLGKLTLIAATAQDPVKPSHFSHMAGKVAVPATGRALEGFSLRFQGAGGTLPQDTYMMQQGGIGTFPLFLVPEGPGGSNRPTYLAIFTRFANTAPNTRVSQSE